MENNHLPLEGYMYHLIIFLLTLFLVIPIKAQVKLVKITKDSTFTFTLPDSTQSSLVMLNRGDVVELKHSMTDLQGITWYQIVVSTLGKMHLWIASSSGELVAQTRRASPSMAQVCAALLQEPQNDKIVLTVDKKRRISLIKQNPNWPFRVKSAVRQGRIILEMTSDQVAASWGQPHKIREGFLEGKGKVKFLFYNREAESDIVTLADNRVIGWNN
jgi:hypothetical protein